MKRLLLTGAALVLTAGAAMAADMSVPFKAGPVVAPAYYSWTGCYLGIHGGGAAFRDAGAGTWSDGGLFGGQVGCNYQIDHLVVGVEGGGSWSGVDSTQHFQPFGLGAALTTTTFKNEWDADLAFRFGIAYDRFFFYGKTGIMWADHRLTNAIAGPAGAVSFSGSETLPAFFWGFGLEYGVAPQWTVKWETDFAFFAATDMNLRCTSSAALAGCGGLVAANGTFSENSMAVISKVGINYRW